MEPTTTPEPKEDAMSSFTNVQSGCLPVGTKLPGFGTIVRSSLTAYEVEWSEPCVYGSYRRTAWLPFQQVHGAPSPVEPLVVFA